MNRKLGFGLVLTLALALAPAPCGASDSIFYPPSKKDAGALWLAQVMALANQSDIEGLGADRQRLLDSGIPDSALVAGSLALGRIFCCGGIPERFNTNKLYFYIPPDVVVNTGDIVEVRLGREPTKHGPGSVNRVARVRDPASSPVRRCRWDPPNDRMWLRVIVCDSLVEDGWSHKRGIGHPWTGPAEPDTLR